MLKLSIILPLVGFVLIFVILFFLYNLNKKKVEDNTNLLRHRRKVALAELETEWDDDVFAQSVFEEAIEPVAPEIMPDIQAE